MNENCLWKLAVLVWLVYLVNGQSESNFIRAPENKVYRNGVDTAGYVSCILSKAGLSETIFIFVSYRGIIYNSVNVGGWVGSAGAKFSLPDDAGSTGNYTLMIKNLSRNDTGEYACQVGEEYKSGKITVGDPPEVPDLDPVTNEFTENQTVTFTCRSKGNLPMPTFKWMKGNEEHFAETTKSGQISTSSLSLKLTNLDDQTAIKCTAMNELGEKSNQKFIMVKYVPRIEILPKDLIVTRGARFDLICDIKANPSPSSVTWFKNGDQIGSTRNHADEGITDDAIYKCQATNSISQNSVTSTVVVHYAPKVMIVNGQEESPVEGSDLTLTCNVTAKPEPHTIQWLYDGSVIGEGRILTLTAIKKEQSGEYMCKAINRVNPTDGASSEKTTSNTIIVNVNYKPSKPSLRLSPETSDGVYREGTNVTFICQVPSGGEGRPEGAITWFKEGPSSIELGFGEPDRTFKIFAAKIEDTTRYWCEIINRHGKEASELKGLTIQATPVLLQPTNSQNSEQLNGTLDSEVRISCLFKGNPTPRIRWYKDHIQGPVENGNEIRIENVNSENPSFNVTSTLIISRDKINERHNGTYRCKAENVAGESTDTYSYHLHLYFAPKLAGEDRAAGDIGKSLSIHCDITSNPPVQQSFEFFRNDQRLQSGSRYEISGVLSNVDGFGFKQRQTLMIKMLEEGDLGPYECRARNTYGTRSFKIDVSSSSEPEKPRDLAADVTSWDQIELSWTPGFSGGYEQMFIISIISTGSVGEIVTIGSTYNLTGLKPGQTYHIKIAANNTKGRSEFSDTITVKTDSLTLPELSIIYDEDKNVLTISMNTNRTDLCVIVEGGDGDKYKSIVGGCIAVDGEKSFNDLQKYGKYRVKACLTTRDDICSSAQEVEGESGIPTWAIIVIIIVIVLVIICIGIIVGICWCKNRKSGGDKSKATKSGHINPLLTGKSAGSVDHMHLSPSIGYNHNSELDQEVDQIDSTHYGNYGEPYRTEQAPPTANDNLEYVYASVQKKSAEQNKLNEGNYFDNYEMRETVNSQHSNSDNTDDFDDGPPPSPYRHNDLSFISDGHNIPVRRYPSFSESGYSTPDSKQTKKVVYEVIV